MHNINTVNTHAVKVVMLSIFIILDKLIQESYSAENYASEGVFIGTITTD